MTSTTPDSRAQPWSSQIPTPRPNTPQTAEEPRLVPGGEVRSYRTYLKCIRESRPYWFLIDQLYSVSKAVYEPSPYKPASPILILEIASDGSTRYFKCATLDEFKGHLKVPFVRNGYGYQNMSNKERRVILVTDIQASVLDALGDAIGIDFGFFADHLLLDEHVSYTSRTTRGGHLHVLEEEKPPSRRFQFEYRELGRVPKIHQSTRNVCQVFERPSQQFNWDAIFQRRFSGFTCTPPEGGVNHRVYLFDEHAFRGSFALGISRLGLPSFVDFKNGEDAAFDRSLGIYQEEEQHNLVDTSDKGTPFQNELFRFFKGPNFEAIRAFESSSYILAYILKLTLVMWRHLLAKIEHSFLGAIENKIISDDVHDLIGGSLSSVSAELSKCAHLVTKKTMPTIKALIRDDKGKEDLEGVLEEYVALSEEIQYVAARAEKAHGILLTKLAIVESKKAIEHSRRGIALAKKVGRLTYLAFIFVPLSFVASFLGMNDISLDGDFSAQTKRVIWVFFAISLPLVLLTTFFAVPYRTLSVAKRSIYLLRRRFGIGWAYETDTIEKHYPEKGSTWEEYHLWLCSLRWERRENVHPRTLIVMAGDGNDKGTQMRVGLILGVWLHLAHAWRNVK